MRPQVYFLETGIDGFLASAGDHVVPLSFSSECPVANPKTNKTNIRMPAAKIISPGARNHLKTVTAGEYKNSLERANQ